MPLLLGHDRSVGEWAGSRFGVTFHPPYSAWGRIDPEGRLTGAVIYSNFNGSNVEVTVTGDVLRREMLGTVVEYVFIQLGCNRLTARTHRWNRHAQKLMSRGGFEYECTMRRYYGPEKQDDALIFGVVAAGGNALDTEENILMDAPKPPDPMKTAQAQAGMNRETAITQYGLGATNQRTPYGNLTYRQIGKWPDGTPRYQATTSLSPEMQNLYNNYTALGGKLGDIGNRQALAVGDTLSQPFKLGNEQTEARLMELGQKRLDPLFNQRQAELETSLTNAGMRRGTPAYNKAMEQFGQQRNDAYNSLMLSGRGQAAQESLAERNQPLAELSSIMSGTAPQSPQFQSTPQPGVQGVDYTGLVNQQYQAKQQAHQGMMGGLFGLGSSLLGGWAMSSRDAKENISKVGTLDNGLNVYSFRYKDGGPQQLGLMADEVERAIPDAVRYNADGLQEVNYTTVAERLS